jgi:hypothetical protein
VTQLVLVTTTPGPARPSVTLSDSRRAPTCGNRTEGLPQDETAVHGVQTAGPETFGLRAPLAGHPVNPTQMIYRIEDKGAP